MVNISELPNGGVFLTLKRQKIDVWESSVSFPVKIATGDECEWSCAHSLRLRHKSATRFFGDFF